MDTTSIYYKKVREILQQKPLYIKNENQLYEILGCYIYNLKYNTNILPWNELPPEVRAPHVRDMGIDGFDSEKRIALQAKNYNRATITHTKIGTFYGLAKSFYDSKELIILCPKPELVNKGVENSVSLLKKIEDKIDCVIFDEGHHSYSESRNLKVKKKLEFSATLCESEGRRIDYSFDISRGIEENFLNDFSIHLLEVQGDVYSSLIESIEKNALYGRILGFCNSVENLRNVERKLNERGIKCNVIIASTTPKKRIKIIESFIKNEVNIILSVRCLSEGIDIPCAKTCIFFDLPSNEISVIQKIGRVLRYSPDKLMSYVVMGVNSAENGEIENEEEVNFILESLESCFSSSENKKGNIRNGRICIRRINEEIESENEMKNDFYRIVNETFIERRDFQTSLDLRWTKNFKYTLAFATENLRMPSSRSKNKKEKRVSTWVSTQRQNFGRNLLSQDRIDRLNSLPVEWKGRIDEDKKWMVNSKIYQKFYLEFKREPSKHSKNKDEKNIGEWVSVQKQKFLKNILSKERIDLLDSVSDKWKINRKENWIKSFESTRIFILENSRLPSRISKNEDEKFLGEWVIFQRRCFRKNTLSEEKIDLLNSISFDWGEKGNNKECRNEKWLENYEKLRIFYSKNSRMPSASYTKTKDERFLAEWVWSLKRQLRKNTLSKERIDLLNLVPVWKKIMDRYQPDKK